MSFSTVKHSLESSTENEPNKANVLLSLSNRIIRLTNEFLDALDLVRLQEALLSTAPKAKDSTKRDFSFLLAHFEELLEKHRKKDYPSGSRRVNVLSNFPAQPSTSKPNYRTAYLASVENPSVRYLLNRIIAGDLAAVDKIMKKENSADVLSATVYRNQHSKTLHTIAYEYKHSNLLALLWRPWASFFGLNTGKLNTSGRNALMMALLCYQNDIVSNLIMQGINLNAVDNGGVSALMYAATTGNAPAIKTLLDKSANVQHSRRGYIGYTALTCASIHNQPAAISLLLAGNANVNLCTYKIDGSILLYTPLIAATWKNNTDCVLALLQNGADCTVRNDEHETALHWAVEHSDIISLKALLKKQADDKVSINQNPLLAPCKRAGNTPFHLALVQQKELMASPLLEAAASDANPNVLKNLLTHFNKNGDSALSLAAAFPTFSMANQILTYAETFNINFPLSDIRAVLPHAMKQNNIEAIRLLCKNAALNPADNELLLNDCRTPILSPASMFSSTRESKTDQPADDKSTVSSQFRT